MDSCSQSTFISISGLLAFNHLKAFNTQHEIVHIKLSIHKFTLRGISSVFDGKHGSIERDGKQGSTEHILDCRPIPRQPFS